MLDKEAFLIGYTNEKQAEFEKEAFLSKIVNLIKKHPFLATLLFGSTLAATANKFSGGNLSENMRKKYKVDEFSNKDNIDKNLLLGRK